MAVTNPNFEASMTTEEKQFRTSPVGPDEEVSSKDEAIDKFTDTSDSQQSYVSIGDSISEINRKNRARYGR